jgi:hypothetical protein
MIETRSIKNKRGKREGEKGKKEREGKGFDYFSD